MDMSRKENCCGNSWHLGTENAARDIIARFFRCGRFKQCLHRRERTALARSRLHMASTFPEKLSIYGKGSSLLIVHKRHTKGDSERFG